MFEELAQELNLSEEQVIKLNEITDKEIQKSNDRIRTEYSKKVKELEQYKPIEKSETEIELENLRNELSETKFQKTLKDIGVDDSLARFIKSDCDISELEIFVKGFAQAQKDFIPNNVNQNDSSITKEQFKKMNYQQKAELYEKSPELFQQLNQK